jgi:hypothetical protein
MKATPELVLAASSALADLIEALGRNPAGAVSLLAMILAVGMVCAVFRKP